jgi:hypothetical protein
VTAKVEPNKKFQEFIERLIAIDRTQVFIGVLSSGKAQESHGLATQVDVATWNEFGVTIDGVEHVPERSFLRATIDLKHAEITKRAATELGKVFTGKQSVTDAYERIGAAAVGIVQDRIAAGIAPDNDPATIERKGSSTPLIDTGQLRGSITYEVRT